MTRIQNNAAQTIKLLSLFAICYGHIFMTLTAGEEPDFLMNKWWVLDSIGLFYFAMSSAYYTTLHYDSPQSMKRYWPRKVSRIGLQFLFINAILFCYFLIQGRDGIFTLHSLVNILGLNGFLNWFRIPNVSPFGAGQWFITVLLLFYLVYPLINRCFTHRSSTTFLLVIAALAGMAGESYLHYGHSLWPTSFGFIAGFYLCRNNPSQRTLSLYAAGLVLALIMLRVLDGTSFILTYSVIAVIGFWLGLLTLPKDIPWLGFNSVVRPLEAIFLPLFLMHTYFFKYTLVAQPYINALINLACNVILAKIVAMAYERFQRALFP
jgi:hypothetical protein